MTHASAAETESSNRRRGCDEPSLEALLADKIMEPVLRSAHLDRERLRQQLSEAALRVYVKTTASTD